MLMALELVAEVTVEHVEDIAFTSLKSDFPEVRLIVIVKLDKVSFIISMRKLSRQLMSATMDLAGNKIRRARLAIIMHAPLLAGQLDKARHEV